MKYLLDGEETERIRFRLIEERDFEYWLPFFRDAASFKHWKAENEAPEEACSKWYQKQFHRYANDLGGMNALVEKSNNQLIGHCGLLVQNVDGITELEIGYSLLPAAWNKGFATEAAKKCKTFAFDNSFADSLISIISLTNLPSENVAIKNGMKLDKKTIYNDMDVKIFRIYRVNYIHF